MEEVTTKVEMRTMGRNEVCDPVSKSFPGGGNSSLKTPRREGSWCPFMLWWIIITITIRRRGKKEN